MDDQNSQQPRSASNQDDIGYITPPPPPPAVHRVFLGPDGLRVPWRILLYLMMAILISIVLVETTSFLWPAHASHRLWEGLVSEAELALAAIIPAFIMGAIERRPFSTYGLPLHQAFAKNFWVGAVWGIAALTVLLLIMRGIHVFYFGTLALHGRRITEFALFYAVFFLVVGFLEDFLARGYLQFTLAQGIGFWPAAIVLSAGFGAIHLGNSGESWIGIAVAALIGLFFCLTLYRTGSLWWAIGFHMSWDWGESYFYSVPDSGTKSPGHLLTSSFHGSRWLTGGTVGPEGSVLILLLLCLLWIAFDRAYPERRWENIALHSRPTDSAPRPF